jgi:hypothetical protein
VCGQHEALTWLAAAADYGCQQKTVCHRHGTRSSMMLSDSLMIIVKMIFKNHEQCRSVSSAARGVH